MYYKIFNKIFYLNLNLIVKNIYLLKKILNLFLFINNSRIKHMKSINLKKLVKFLCFSYKFKGPIIKKNYQMYKKAIDNRVFLSFIKKYNKSNKYVFK